MWIRSSPNDWNLFRAGNSTPTAAAVDAPKQVLLNGEISSI